MRMLPEAYKITILVSIFIIHVFEFAIINNCRADKDFS
jgi:hypothetical protein